MLVYITDGLTTCSRDRLDQANGINEEINNILASGVDEDQGDLEDELDRLEQEAKDEQVQDLTNKMLDTGSVPVSDQIQRVPAAPTGESKLSQRSDPILFMH